jgi:hypothetical protein
MSRSKTAPVERTRPRGVTREWSVRALVAAALATTSLVGGTSALEADQPGARVAATTTVVVATQPAAPGPDVHRLTVRAAPATRPALQYRLLPDPLERTPGNAAQVYLLSFLQSLQVPPDASKLTDADAARFGIAKPESQDLVTFYLYDVPLERLSDPQVEQFLGKFQNALATLDVAARRDHCEWDLPVREQGFSVLLTHLNPARALTNVDRVRVRLDVARHDYRSATRHLQTAMSLGRDLGTGKPLLIEGLVGAGVATAALQQVETLLEQPDAPNLYWSLADLPRPFVDMAAAIREERGATVRGLADQAEMRRMKEGRFTAADWDALVARITHVNDAFGAKRPLESKLGSVAGAVVLYPAAKEYLIRRGVPAAEVDAMPVPAALARYYVESFDEWWDETLKWTNLPIWEAYRGMRQTEDAFRRAETGFASNPLLSLMPALSRAYLQGAILDRRIAALQTVEALRHYAATHDGRLPASLADLAPDTPAPADPTTGQPFAYKVDGHRVTIDSPGPPGAEGGRNELRVEVTFVK